MDRDISAHEAWFRQYAAAEKALLPQGEDAGPMDLKSKHTFCVLANARRMVESEDFPPIIGRACLLAALYHDVARFEQYLHFHTFKDKLSRNHGQWGVRILKARQCLSGEEPAVRKLVLAGVGLHNQFRLPPHLPAHTATVAHVVRDADKLDILRVMDEHLAGPGPYNPTVVLSLPHDPALASAKVLDDALHGRVAAYADLSSVNDFRVLLNTWLFDMHFTASREQFARDGHARRLLEGLPQDSLYGPVRAYLGQRLAALHGG